MENQNQGQSVQTVELFYDLVFVYLISRIAHVFESVEAINLISFENIVKFTIMFFVVWMIWTYQVVYINRFFRGKLYEYALLFFNMYIILILSQNFSIIFEDTFKIFVSCTTILSVSIGIQYWINYIFVKDVSHREFSKAIFISLTASSFVAVIALCLDTPLKMLVYFFSILIAMLLPLKYRTSLRKVPVRFHHLAERYELLVILFFGEALVGVAKVMGNGNFYIGSLLSFMIIIALFSLYTVNFGVVRRYHEKTAGLTLIFSHLLIIMSIMFITILLEKLAHMESFNPSYTLSILICIVVFIAMIQINLCSYTTQKFSGSTSYSLVLALVVSFVLVMYLPNILAAKLVILVLLILFNYYYKKKAIYQ